MKLLCVFMLASIALFSCQAPHKPEKAQNGAFIKAQPTDDTNINRITESGELIIATMSGPDTYFDYQGINMGMQYALAENFATTLGVGIRVELANDTTELIKKLQTGDVDLIALQLTEGFCKTHHLQQAGAYNKNNHTAWAVNPNATDLIQALNNWYGDGVELHIAKQEKQRMNKRCTVRRKVKAPYISREKGIISTYDEYLKQAAMYTGWDWRLLAAQCYQESGFDPNAVSWAGAKGLMQLMPATAQQMGVPQERIFYPKENIAGGAKYLRLLQGYFKDIKDPEERIKFVLASYNGGYGHISDAQALARKHGRNAHSWDDVSFFVYNLSQPRYYRDPAVRHGYMIGSETFNYVRQVMERWRMYGGSVRNMPSTNMHHSASQVNTADNISSPTHRKKNRFSKKQKIMSPQELQNISNNKP